MTQDNRCVLFDGTKSTELFTEVLQCMVKEGNATVFHS